MDNQMEYHWSGLKNYHLIYGVTKPSYAHIVIVYSLSHPARIVALNYVHKPR